ncbi:hypothetical protein CEXT_631401 [Caerostris extrusa]|uniref:Uncharacterized protein n=1 Tax=Caerostris extrusa TaxID=172846 RepID=A0AAV4YDG4_CAEEX|nr:hypothetical protein CEXT_631401 [Caerostris extrusa]
MGDVPMPCNWGASQQFGLGETPGGDGGRIFGRRNTPPVPCTPEKDVRRLLTGADAVKPPGHSYLFSCPFYKTHVHPRKPETALRTKCPPRFPNGYDKQLIPIP